jgi:hypothetical protein
MKKEKAGQNCITRILITIYVGHVLHIELMRNAYKIFVGKLEGKIPIYLTEGVRTWTKFIWLRMEAWRGLF